MLQVHVQQYTLQLICPSGGRVYLRQDTLVYIRPVYQVTTANSTMRNLSKLSHILNLTDLLDL